MPISRAPARRISKADAGERFFSTSVMLVIFPRGLIHPLKQVAGSDYRSSPKAALWVAYPLQQRFGPSSRKPIGGSPLVQPTTVTATRRPSELFRAGSTPLEGTVETYPHYHLPLCHPSALALHATSP